MHLPQLADAAGDERHQARRRLRRQVPHRTAADRELLHRLDGGHRRGALDVAADGDPELRRARTTPSNSTSSDGSTRIAMRTSRPNTRRELARGREDLQLAAGRRGLVGVRVPSAWWPIHSEPNDTSTRPGPVGGRLRVCGAHVHRTHDERRQRDCGDAPHLRATCTPISPLSPARGTTTTRSTKVTRKSMSTLREASKKLSTSASSSGSTRRT